MSIVPSAMLGAALAYGAFQPVAVANDGEPTKVVRVADLDLTRPDGAERLYRRIRIAAREVCQIPILNRHWSPGVQRACFERAVDRAVQSVASTQLSRVHGEHVLRLAGH